MSYSRPSSAGLRGAAALAGIVALAALGGCVTRTREIVVERPAPPATVVVQQPAAAPAGNVRTIPGPINEERGLSPGAGYSWLSGHWAWDGTRWVWQPGRWLQGAAPAMPGALPETMGSAPGPAYYWVPGHWVYRAANGAWVWLPGAWRS